MYRSACLNLISTEGKIMTNHSDTDPKSWRLVLLVPILLAALVTILGKGGGTAPPAPPGDTTVPMVSSSTPADNSTGVVLDTLVTATFSEKVNSGTIDTSSFMLRNARDAIIPAAVTLDMNSNMATLTPNQPLSMATRYTATLSTAITDVAGNALAATVSWNFTAADGQWGTATKIENDDSGRAEKPQIAFDSSGNAFAVWQQYNGTRWDIYANIYTAGSWGMPERIGTGDFGDEREPQIVTDANGNALAVWLKSDASDNVFSSFYTAGTGNWGAPEQVNKTFGGNATSPQVAFDASGNAMAIWSGGAEPNGIYFNRYTAGVGWATMSSPVTDILVGGSNFQPQIAIDANGDALAIWLKADSMGTKIWASRYTLGTGWGAEEPVESDKTGNSSGGQIEFDPNGNAIAVWVLDDNITANRYTPGAGWGTEEPLESNSIGMTSGFFGEPQIGIDSDGNALVVWQRTDNMDSSIYSNRYTVGIGWGMAELIETGGGRAGSPQIAIDPNGNALAIWQQTENPADGDDAVVNRYTLGAGWSSAQIIGDNTESTSLVPLYPQIAIDTQGNAMAIWAQSNNNVPVDSIWANRLQ
jgi:hypothetical protein